VLVSDELKSQMVKPKSPEVGVWKENLPRKPRSTWKLTSSFLIEKYTREWRGSVFNRLGRYKRRRSPDQGLDINEDRDLHNKGARRGWAYLLQP
jgi:hypothetical protein